MIEIINATTFKEMIVGGTNNLRNNSQEINDLNVFPVPDGDTGINMSRTMEGGLIGIKDKDYDKISDLLEDFIHGALFSARGNSGVILSQICKGVQVGLKDVTDANYETLCKALEKGVEYAYQSVEKPVEGTILTVYREAVEEVRKSINNGIKDIEELLKIHIEKAEKILAKTIDMLPVLKEAGVIDSGGAGYVKIIEGIYKALTGEEIVVDVEQNGGEALKIVDYSAFSRDSIMEFGYCTELTIRLQSSKVNVDNFDINEIKDFLKENNGDSIVTYLDGDVVKVHVHTLTPGVMLNGLQKFGEFLAVKIENMTLQHEETIKEEIQEEKNIASVVVANGNGLVRLFKELGVSQVVDGGQTGNPSSGDFIKAFEKINAKNILVFPNNGNIILAAEQAAKLYTKANVIVIPTKTIQQGYCAVSVIVDEAEIDSLVEDINYAIENVKSFEVTYAIRDAKINGVTVKKNQFMCICDGKLLNASDSKVVALVNSLKKVEDIENKEMLTVFYGKDILEEDKELFREAINNTFDFLDLIEYEGNQEIYSFLASLE